MSVSVLNTDAQLSAKTVDLLESDQTITGLKTFDRDPSAPFAVSASSAVVANLDADKVDGLEAAAFVLKAGSTMTGALIGDAGTVAAPGIAIRSSDNGLYSSAADSIELATNGTKALGIDSTQFIDSPTQPRARARNSAVQSVANNTLTALTLDTEDYDIGAMHSTASNTSRMTVPTGGDGLYLIIGKTAFAASATGNRLLRLTKNGSAIGADVAHEATATIGMQMMISCVEVLAAADYIELVAYQNTGGNLDVGGASAQQCSELTIVKLW